MDTTEVTQAQYEVFRTAGVPITSQPHARCDPESNPSFDIEEIAPYPDLPPVCRNQDYDPLANPDYPVVCAGFCDAIAYCAWAGKRLCGALGRAGEELGSWQDEDSEFNLLKNDPEHDQWYNACSGGGEREYPYGSTEDPERCPMSMDPHPDCAVLGSDPPILGVLGGVGEYQDFCAEEGTCYQTGETTGAGNGSCSRELTSTTPGPQMGFRCCYEFDE
jgi:hypothetical protein